MATKFNRFQAGDKFVVASGTRVKSKGGVYTQLNTRVVTLTGIRSTRTKSGNLKTEILWKSCGYTSAAVI
jgi:hypothetical protein